jgi:hypothetical protein
VPDKFFALTAPWAHFDPNVDDMPFARKQLSPTEPTRVASGFPIFLVNGKGQEVRVSGHQMAVHQLGTPYNLGGKDYSLSLLSVGVLHSEEELEIEVDGEHVGTIQFIDFLPRPTFSAGKNNTNIPAKRAEELDIFLLTIIDLLQMANDPQYRSEQVVWDRISKAWTEETSANSVPPMALIVRHAEKLSKLTRELHSTPRLILQRVRELTPLDRVQQLDIASVRWLSRQPGENEYERAGPRQRIMSVQRHQSVDTLENRVFTDFANRTYNAAITYINRYKNLSNSERWKKVNVYGRRSKRISQDLKANGVANVIQPVVPNFVLLQDTRYRRIWRAYQELRRQKNEEDECWRWQHRLWSDYAKVLLHLALRISEDFTPLAEMSLRVREEQQRGIWVGGNSQSGTWVHGKSPENETAVSLIWSMSSDHHKIHPLMSGLGCQAMLHVQRLKDRREAFIPVWTYHAFGLNRPDLKELANSAARALKNCTNNAQLVEDLDLDMKGIMIVSNFEAPGFIKMELNEKRDVIVVEGGAGYNSRKQMLHQLPKVTSQQITSIFGAE